MSINVKSLIFRQFYFKKTNKMTVYSDMRKIKTNVSFSSDFSSYSVFIKIQDCSVFMTDHKMIFNKLLTKTTIIYLEKIKKSLNQIWRFSISPQTNLNK